MACTALAIDTGLFLTTNFWEQAPTKSFDGKTVTLNAAGISVTKSGMSPVFHAKLANRVLHYMVLGNKFLLILDVESGAGPSQRWVSLVNFGNGTEVPILNVLASSNGIALPVVHQSAMSGTVFLAYGQNGTEQTSVAIYRSDNGDVLCSLGSPIVSTGETKGEATATELIIHYSTGGTSKTKTEPRPLGKCTITPSSQTFPDVFIGGCPFTPPTKQFTIKNTGNDCLTVNAISGSGPFQIQSTSVTLPATLAKNETFDVTVAFNPSAPGNFNPVDISVPTSPVNGDDKLRCKAEAKPAEFKINFSASSVNFGKVPVGQTSNKSIAISNTGSKPLTISSAGVVADGYTVAAFNTTIDCGAAPFSVPIQFLPTSEGPHSATFSVTHQATGSPKTISLAGEGCIANAEIVVPAAAPIDFGQIEQGFRTVRFFTVDNVGDGPLTFEGGISGADAALFGLPDPNGSVTNPPATRTYSVNPVSPCGGGGAGSGTVVVAVSFHANDAPPKLASATLTLSDHNATNHPAAKTWVFPLSAEITPPVALDIGLVIDRSDSMNDALGSRVKMDAAIAAGQLFAELLRADFDDRVAVVRFNNERNVVVDMTPVTTTGSPTQDQIRQMIDTDVRPATGLTAIAGGTAMAIAEVQKPRPTPPAQLRKAVVVLTDGIENTGYEDPPGTWLSIKGGSMWKTDLSGQVGTVPASFAADVTRYCIGVGKDGEIDPTQLDALAGDSNRVMRVKDDLAGKNYFELEKYYTQIFMDIVGTQPILDPMWWIQPGETHEIEFDLLRGDVSALIVIYDYQGLRLPFFCVSPAGEIVDPAMIPAGFQLRSGFTHQARLVEFRVPHKEPERYAGRWKVVVTHKGVVCRGNPNPKSELPGFLPRDCTQGFKAPVLYGLAIGAGSNFRMFPFVTPSPVYVGEPILLSALVSEAGLPVKGCHVTVEAISPGGAQETLTLLDDGAHGDGGANDGEYAREFTHTFSPGTYHFKFRATGYSRDGEPVVREAQRDKAVLPKHQDTPPGTGNPGGGGRPNDGDQPVPPRDRCCEELKKAIEEQTHLLRRLLEKK